MSSLLLRHSWLLRNNNSLSLLLQNCRMKHRNHPGFKKKPFATPVRLELPDDYVEEAIYPPVKPQYPPGDWPETTSPKLAWHYHDEGQKFHSLKTIQERMSVMAYLNVQQTMDDLSKRSMRYYPIYQLSALPKTPQMLPFSQYITKTHVDVLNNFASDSVLSDEASDSTSSPATGLDSSISQEVYAKLKASVKDAILMNFAHKNEEINEVNEAPIHEDSYVPEQHKQNERLKKKIKNSDLLLKDILNSISTILASTGSNEHLYSAQYASNVNIKAYWKRCGYKEQRPRGAYGIDIDTIRYQFDDEATYQIKCDRPLMPNYKLTDKKCVESEVPDYAYNPSGFKIFADHVLPNQAPGHWYGDSREFNFLTVYNTTKMLDMYSSMYQEGNGEYDFDSIKSMAITAGHAELTAQAYYLGFSMWKDLTYPLVAQLLLSNGQDFSVAAYQLNTLKLWNKATPANNLCSITLPERLFELNDDLTDLTSFNEELFKKILKVFCNRPCESKNEHELVENYSQLDHTIGGSRLRPYLAINDFENQLPIRHKLFATSLYELVKYDKPANYLNLRSENDPVTYRPRFPRLYDKFTYEFRDIVLDYYPRDFYGFKLVERMLKQSPKKETEKFWDLKHPVYEWASVPPPDTNNIPRDINLPKF